MKQISKENFDELINIATGAATLGVVLSGDDVIARFEKDQGPLAAPIDSGTDVIGEDTRERIEEAYSYLAEMWNAGPTLKTLPIGPWLRQRGYNPSSRCFEDADAAPTEGKK